MQSTNVRRGVVPLEAQRRGGHRRLRRAAIIAAVVFVTLAAAAHWRNTLAVRGSDLSRSVIGANNTVRIEAVYFRLDDRFKRLKYSIFGGGGGNPISPAAQRHVAAAPAASSAKPAAPAAATQAAPTAMAPDAAPAAIAPIYPHALSQGEGTWTTIQLAGALRTPYTAHHPIYTTFIRPDPQRPYATVTLAEFSAASIALHPVAGTSEPGVKTGIAGPGAIPSSVLDSGALLAAFNGGFRWQDGHYGMIVDGQTIAPMADGLATLATYRDGSFRIGTWGKDIGPSPNLVSARQNAILLIDHGAISSKIDAGGRTWGFIWYTSRNFFTTRSAIGLTADGRFVFAGGYETNARTLATALHQAGVVTAMQLDVNKPYTQMALYEAPQSLIQGFNLTDWMHQSPQGFFTGRARDFVYITIR
ncbi:MAG: phosphodiester glycosidase family protein [Dehalococcoidia bacterium]